MTVMTLFDNFVGPWGEVQAAGDQSQATPFDVTSTTICTAVGFNRATTGSGRTPAWLALWEIGNSTPLWSSPSPTDDGNAGMQWTDLGASQVTLTAGHHYLVGEGIPAGTYFTRVSGSSRATAPTGVSWPSDTRFYSGSASLAYPGSQDNAFWNGVTVYCDDSGASPPPSGTVGAEIENAFQRWEGTSDNTRPTGLPVLTKAAVDAVKTELDDVQTVINGLQNVVDTNSSLVALPLKALLARYAADITTIEGYLPTIEGRTGPPGSGGGSGTVSDDILTALQPVIDSVQPPAPATWVSLGTTAFDTSLALAVQADLYQVTFTDLGSGRVNLTADGVDVAYRLAWWTEWDGEFAQERRFVDFPKANLYAGGKRMAGLLLHSPMGASGTVEAWTLS